MGRLCAEGVSFFSYQGFIYMLCPTDRKLIFGRMETVPFISALRRLAVVFAILLGQFGAAQSRTIDSLKAMHGITNSEASDHLPVAFEATVTYYRAYERTMFVQDGDVAIYVQPFTDAKVVAGDRVLIQGTTHESFRPFVVSSSITLLRHGSLPAPVPATFDQLIRSQYDCRLVTLRGTVRAADLAFSSKVRSTTLRIQSDGGYIDAVVDSDDPAPLKEMLDADVEITGADSGRFDGKMQMTGTILHVSSLAGVKVLKRPMASPWTLPETPMSGILSGFHVKDLTKRIRVHGTLTYYQPGSAAVLQNGTESLWIQTQTIMPLGLGELVDATGFPNVHDGFLTLTDSEIQDTHLKASITPLRVTREQLSSSRNVFDLVSIDGQVVTEVHGDSQDAYILVRDGRIFSANYRHSDTSGLLPMQQIAPGSRVIVTGICILDSSNPFDREVPFEILMRTPADIVVVVRPSWLNVRNLVTVIAVMLIFVVGLGVRGWLLERNMRHQVSALAQIERRRGAILEDISGDRPLAEILEQITELASFRLHGAPCWCQVADGARLGKVPSDLSGLRISHLQIPGRSGTALGTLFVAFDPLTKPSAEEEEALSLAARLAALSIETRRLHSELVHRSEFDLLTDTHNRFSLDKHLQTMIENARQTASIFGLIYIDLDDFKQINDRHGHQIGDVYLQEVALRMKRQLRPVDSLARVGGDEFAALIPEVHCRGDADEIAQRMVRCFDEPFLIDGMALKGAASAGLAVYPEDATTRDGLLKFADVAMYAAKNRRRERAIATNENPAGNVAPQDRC